MLLGLEVLLRVVDDRYALLAAGPARLAILGREATDPASRRWSLGSRSIDLAIIQARLLASGLPCPVSLRQPRGLPGTGRHRPRRQPDPPVRLVRRPPPLTCSQSCPCQPLALIGILTVSDRASRGEYADEGGPAIRDYLGEVLASPWESRERIVPDDLDDDHRGDPELAAGGCCLS